MVEFVLDLKYSWNFIVALLDLGNKIIVRPNHSLSRENGVKVLAILFLLMMLVAIGFVKIGAWLVLPFAGLEFLAFIYAFHLIYAHAGDYESISVEGDDVKVERKSNKDYVSVSFNRYWASVTLRNISEGRGLMARTALFIGSHGKEVEFGRMVGEEQRLQLARQIRQKIKNIN
jgi:uncharacterized membrane protein